MEEKKNGVITQIKQQLKNWHRYSLFIDDQYAFSVHENVLVKHRLLKGMPIESDKMECILKDEERNKAHDSAIRSLQTRPKSVKEIKRHLKQKGYEEQLINEVVHSLLQKGYMDDQKFAEQWTEHRMLKQFKGSRLVREELREKGVSSEWIEQAIDQIDEQQEFQQALQLGEKKLKQTKPDLSWNDIRRKLGGLLMRRGFSMSLVNKVLFELSEQWETGHLNEEHQDD